jgi:PAS domain S-box-containing protein
MERRRTSDERSAESRANSGVFRAVASEALSRLRCDLVAAGERVSALRAGIVQRRTSTGDGELGWKALQEIDTAHEELRTAEEALHTQAEELLSTRATFDRERRIYGELFEAAPEAYVVTDELGVVMQANRRASSLFQLDNAFLIGKPLAALIAQPDRGVFRDLLGVICDESVRAQLRVLPRKADKPLWAGISAHRAVRDESSICVLWLFRDIDAEKQEEARRSEREEQLHGKVRELERIFMEIAHELRGPLGSIAGWLHMYAQSEEADSSIRSRALNSMTRSVRALARIAEDLFTHARVESRAAGLRATPLNLVRVLIHVVDDLRPLIDMKGIRMEFSISRHAIDINADPWHLQQVFRNLVGNAIKFTPEHGTIRVGISVSDRHATVSISDTGPGIERGALSKIFTPFTKLSSAGRDTGLGLGLSIAQRLVELHGGTITAESEGPGRGSTFRVRLPVSVPLN